MNIKLSSQIRVGKIQYVNTLPFYHGLTGDSPHVHIEENYPAQINRRMQEGALDLAPISSLEYAMHPDDYYLLPELCIGARHFSGSVIFFSKEKIENLNGKAIGISGESLSSQALLKIILRERYQFQNQFVVSAGNPGDILKERVAHLAIGDKALFYEPVQFVYKYDLSELWYDWTNQPFCFSVWAVRRKFFAENSAEVHAFHRRLKQVTKQNLENLENLLKEGLSFTVAHERFAQVFSYLSHLIYDFNQEMQDGLTHFFERAAKLNLIERVPSLEFIPEEK